MEAANAWNGAALLLVLIPGAVAPCLSQTNPNLRTYFKDYIEFSDDQIVTIRSGRAVAKNLHSRTADEILVFGAVYINASRRVISSSPVISLRSLR